MTDCKATPTVAHMVALHWPQCSVCSTGGAVLSLDKSNVERNQRSRTAVPSVSPRCLGYRKPQLF